SASNLSGEAAAVGAGVAGQGAKPAVASKATVAGNGSQAVASQVQSVAGVNSASNLSGEAAAVGAGVAGQGAKPAVASKATVAGNGSQAVASQAQSVAGVNSASQGGARQVPSLRAKPSTGSRLIGLVGAGGAAGQSASAHVSVDPSTYQLQSPGELPQSSASALQSTTPSLIDASIGNLGSVLARVVSEGSLPREITINLVPRELGQVTLHVASLGQAGVTVRIEAAQSATRELVQSHLNEFGQGLSLELGFGGSFTQGGEVGVSPSRILPINPNGDLPSNGHIAATPQSGLTSGLVDLRL
ncbi:MAG: flagellar hook-length control protein FliK, partial [Ferrimicrobium sp.]